MMAPFEAFHSHPSPTLSKYITDMSFVGAVDSLLSARATILIALLDILAWAHTRMRIRVSFEIGDLV